MDRKSNKKVAGIFLIAGFFLLLCFGTIFLYVQKEFQIKNTQMTEMIVLYPELEQELQENFSFYKEQSIKEMQRLMVYLAAVTALSMVIFCWFWKKQQEKEMREINEEASAVYEQLLRFRKGDFQIEVSFFSGKTAYKWEKIYELMRELGYYFAALKEQLEEEENSTKALITDISHQLKTPLASLRMSHELAKADNLSEVEHKEFLAMEEQEINKLESLLEELVNLSRLECNMIQVKAEYKSIKQTIMKAVNQVFMKAHSKNIEMCVELDKDVLIKHDVKWTAEAFVNIIDNAIKYSDSDTTIRIRTEQLPSNLLIEVEDEGMGIPEEEIHKIFKRFYRGERARENVEEGAGVGLYLARSIIEQQGGTIVAKRKNKNGTIFKIILPL